MFSFFLSIGGKATSLQKQESTPTYYPVKVNGEQQHWHEQRVYDLAMQNKELEKRFLRGEFGTQAGVDVLWQGIQQDPFTQGMSNLMSVAMIPIGGGGLAGGGRLFVQRVALKRAMAVNAARASTVIGSDAATLANAGRMIPERGMHQLLVHGHFDKFIVNGTITSPKSVARTLLQSGFKRGTPIRCISCHTGKYSDGAAYQLGRYLRSPVLAPTDKVRILQGGQYEIFGNGIWKQF